MTDNDRLNEKYFDGFNLGQHFPFLEQIRNEYYSNLSPKHEIIKKTSVPEPENFTSFPYQTYQIEI